MSRGKKSRPGDCSTRTATENGPVYETAHDSTSNDTTPRGGGQTGIASLLMCGQQNAIPLRQLKQMTGLPGRELRRRIEVARIAGEPILSDGNGYFLADNQQEVTRFVSSMRRRAKRIQAVAAAVEEAEIN